MSKLENNIEKIVFASRWLQAPLYIGLIIALVAYIILFIEELWHLILSLNDINSHDIIIKTLALIDAVMVSNLIFVVVVGGWQTFISKLNLDEHKDRPDWLSTINAGVLKVKLASAIVSITSVELLIDFFKSDDLSEKTLIWRTIIHCVFLISALIIAYIETLSHKKDHE